VFTILKNIIEVERNSTIWSIGTIPFGHNLSIEVIDWSVSLRGWGE
jgi:hypothetical protein